MVLLFGFPLVARITGMCHHIHLQLVQMGSYELFARTGLELQFS
jgi:hypothetical protein